MGLGNGYNFILGPDLWSVCDYHWQVLKRYNKVECLVHLLKHREVFRNLIIKVFRIHKRGSIKKAQRNFIWCLGMLMATEIWLKYSSMGMLTVTNNLQNLIRRHLQSVSANLGWQPWAWAVAWALVISWLGPGQYCQPPAQPTCTGAQ